MKLKLKYDGTHIDLEFEGSRKEYNDMLDRMNLRVDVKNKTEKEE